MIEIKIDEIFATPLTELEQAKIDFASRQSEARSYLASTAWYIERFSDPSSGKEVPKEVLDKRAEAREILNEVFEEIV